MLWGGACPAEQYAAAAGVGASSSWSSWSSPSPPPTGRGEGGDDGDVESVPLAGVEADGSVVVRAGVGAVCCGGAWSVMAVGVDAATEDAGGSGADTGVGRADGAWHGRTASLAWGEPEDVTPASGPGRGVRRVDVKERVEAGVDAADGAGVDAEDAARTRRKSRSAGPTARKTPKVPYWMARLGGARPAVKEVA